MNDYDDAQTARHVARAMDGLEDGEEGFLLSLRRLGWSPEQAYLALRDLRMHGQTRTDGTVLRLTKDGAAHLPTVAYPMLWYFQEMDLRAWWSDVAHARRERARRRARGW